ncbi:MAG TPA: MFS transporter [Candidatus Limnocylindrales bacterium]|nr:MFS transporter [Candidatus Limnocylindrales bacterium]
MTRGSAYALLGVMSAGVFLAGLELMVTAVALPTIILDFSANAQNPFAELRRASWIVNGYLLAYIVAMPLAGRMADVWGARRLFLGALGLFVAGSFVAGAAQSIDQLIAGRVVQGIGGGILVPVGTAVASHLFEGHARPRALGVIGALTFLGMAAGPFVGAAILGGFDAEGGLTALAVGAEDPIRAFFAPSWRWVFYLNVPIGIAAILIAWAASAGWETPRRGGRIDVVGAVVWTIALGGGLVAVTLLGSPEGTGLDPLLVSAALGAAAVVATIFTIVRGFRVPDPFLDPRLFRSLTFASAAAVSLLTGYAFATAIVGGAVFVDRVLYGGPEQQQAALGSLAAATAIGALVSGFAVRYLSLRLVTVAGLAMSAGALLWMARWTPAVGLAEVALVLATFGAGFGLTVTPRSTAAVETAGRASFGMASAIVTVARMIGMAIGVAVLTAYGSTTINNLYDELFAVPDGWKQVIPEELRDRSLRDAFVVDALEGWAAGKASEILVGLFVVAGVVTIVAVPPGLALGGAARTRMLADDRDEDAGLAAAPSAIAREPDGRDERRPTIAL